MIVLGCCVGPKIDNVHNAPNAATDTDTYEIPRRSSYIANHNPKLICTRQKRAKSNKTNTRARSPLAWFMAFGWEYLSTSSVLECSIYTYVYSNRSRASSRVCGILGLNTIGIEYATRGFAYPISDPTTIAALEVINACAKTSTANSSLVCVFFFCTINSGSYVLFFVGCAAAVCATVQVGWRRAHTFRLYMLVRLRIYIYSITKDKPFDVRQQRFCHIGLHIYKKNASFYSQCVVFELPSCANTYTNTYMYIVFYFMFIYILAVPILHTNKYISKHNYTGTGWSQANKSKLCI